MKNFNAGLQDEINTWIKARAPHSTTYAKQVAENTFRLWGGYAGGFHTRGWARDLAQQFKGVKFI